MRVSKKIFLAGLLAVYTYLVWLMILITLQYVPIRDDAAFLAIKQDFTPMLHYRVAFFVHVFSAIFVLGAGYTQFFSPLRKRYGVLHRRVGWIYAAVTIFLAGPSGLVIGVYANGGLTSQLAFCLLAILWVGFTIKAMLEISRRHVAAHRRWMIRSFALALSALTLRAWKVALVWMFHPHPMDVYRVVAWLGWTMNLLVAELIIHQKHRGTK